MLDKSFSQVCCEGMRHQRIRPLLLTLALILGAKLGLSISAEESSTKPVRIFIFAGQSNMEGADSKVADVDQFPPFRGAAQPQPEVRFSYILGRQNKTRSNGWVPLQPVRDLVGPELTFARHLRQSIDDPIAIIKCAAGGTHLGGDWNPISPAGFKMYPLTLDLIRSSLAELDQQGIPYQLEGVVWHQGENDMFEADYMKNYGDNLVQMIARWRHDLNAPTLPFFIGELCTKTIWGMDLRPRMYAITQGQQQAIREVDHTHFVRSSHIGVEIGNPVGLHYHYGTLGQLEMGVNYANAYLSTIGKQQAAFQPLESWPYASGSRVRLFVLAGHRNMEGERAFRQEIPDEDASIREAKTQIAFRYHNAAGEQVSPQWEALRPVGFFDTFGPELSFAARLSRDTTDAFAVVKFTDSGSQMNDWTPEGTPSATRHVYPKFIRFISDSIADLADRGHVVELAGVFYHIGENEMSMPPYRKQVHHWLAQTIAQSRIDLKLPTLRWYLTQQKPTQHKNVDSIDVVAAIESLAQADAYVRHLKVFDLGEQPKRLVINTSGIIQLGEQLAELYLAQ